MVTLIKDRKIMAHTKKKKNLFLLNFTALGKVITVIIRENQSTHLVSKNKNINIWQYWLVYAKNPQSIKAFKLIYKIRFKDTYSKKYDSVKILIKLNDFNVSNSKNSTFYIASVSIPVAPL